MIKKKLLYQYYTCTIILIAGGINKFKFYWKFLCEQQTILVMSRFCDYVPLHKFEKRRNNKPRHCEDDKRQTSC